MIAKIISDDLRFTFESYKSKTIQKFELCFPSVFICIPNQLSKPLPATHTLKLFLNGNPLHRTKLQKHVLARCIV